MSSIKVIFLDIDGVLCTLRSHLAYHGRGGLWNHWDPVSCEVLRRCCEAGVQLVISSTWRLNCPDPDADSSELGQKLGEHGLRPFVFKHGWRTPRLNGKRGHEVKEWLKLNPAVTDWRILDDDADFLKGQFSRLIKTNALDGMSAKQMLELLKWADVKEGVLPLIDPPRDPSP